MYIFDTFSLEQLAILGMTKEYQILFASAFGLFVLFLFFRPLILLLHYRHYTIVLTYVISSLLMLVILFAVAMTRAEPGIIKAGFEGMAIFGVCCMFYLFYRQIKYTYR